MGLVAVNISDLLNYRATCGPTEEEKITRIPPKLLIPGQSSGTSRDSSFDNGYANTRRGNLEINGIKINE
jgi:hypothetical protein